MILNEREFLIRLGVAALLGAIIGFEREQDNQPAGLRTHIILVVGAALAMILSLNIAELYVDTDLPSDPARIAAQVVSGIGFLGAGAIIHLGLNVKGLTTAASMWTMAVVGLAAGAGQFLLAGTVTGLLFIILAILQKLEYRLFRPLFMIPVTMWMNYREAAVDEVQKIFADEKVRLDAFGYERDFENDQLVIKLEFRARREELLDQIREDLCSVSGLQKIKFDKTIRI